MARGGRKKDQMLREKDQYPTDAVIRKALGASFPAFDAFMKRLKEPEYGLVPEWKYYRDGKAWLCKITRKSKTTLWLSVWEGCFRAGFYFTAATGAGIGALDIDPAIKKAFREQEAAGKLRPLVMAISFRRQLPDLFRVVRYKMDQK